MSKKAVVEGEMILRDHNGNSIEFFSEEFVLDASIQTLEQARVIVKKAMLGDRLQRKHKGFKRVRTAQVISFTDTQEAAEHSDIDRLMIKATELGCVPDNINNYRRPEYKQKALEKAIEVAEKRIKDSVKDRSVIDQGYVA